MEKIKFTKYESARILGARALQISMDAPLLLKIKKEKLEEVKFDPLKIAEIEFESGVLPISVKRPFPKKIESKLKKEVEKEKEKNIDEKIEEKEVEEEEKIKEEGEIMELATPDDEEEVESKTDKEKEVKEI
ncbi:MAG: DNA-directed RNA polymerase subunit K [Nanoarchaeota archaeon]|nr:DNA-directed RNA polymerase subunit K [Nanoarchaeota archaeon]